MTDFQYKRAPITEAVVEIRFGSPIDKKKRDKALKQLSKHYADHNPVVEQTVKLNFQSTGNPKTQTTETINDRFSSVDMTQQLHITDSSFIVSQLAPYTGWVEFQARFVRDWETWRKMVGFQHVERVGMRYINRIDIPVTAPIVRYEDYMAVYPALPELLDPCSFHSINVRNPLKDIGSELNLKSAIVESPLPNHLSIVLDLDIIKLFDTPPSDDDLYDFLSRARVKKNEIFEACVKDKARELFNQ